MHIQTTDQKPAYPDELRHIEAFFSTREISWFIDWIEQEMYAPTHITETNIPATNAGQMLMNAIADILYRWLSEHVPNLPLAMELTEIRLTHLRTAQKGSDDDISGNDSNLNTLKELLGLQIINTLHLLVLINETKNTDSET